MCALLLLHTAQSSEFLEFLHGCQPILTNGICEINFLIVSTLHENLIHLLINDGA